MLQVQVMMMWQSIHLVQLKTQHCSISVRRVRVLYKEPEEWKERVEILTEEIKKLKKVVVVEWVNHLEEIMAPMHAERYLKKIVIDETDTPGVRAKKKKDEEVRVARLDAEAARVVKEEKKKYLPLVKKYLAEVVEELRSQAEHDAKAGDFGKVMATYDEALSWTLTMVKSAGA